MKDRWSIPYDRCPQWIREHEDVSDGAVRLWLLLHSLARDDGAVCLVTHAELAKGPPKRSIGYIKDKFAELVGVGAVLTKQVAGRGLEVILQPASHHSSYQPATTAPTCQLPQWPAGRRGGADLSTRASDETKKQSKYTEGDRSARAREGQEQSRLVQGNGNGHDDFYAGFRAWFNQYPTPRRTNERMALAHWRDTMSDDDRAAALEAVPRFAAVFANSTPEGQRFCRAADRWLRECCWREDESTWAASMAGPTAARAFENKVAPEHRRKDMSEYFDQ